MKTYTKRSQAELGLADAEWSSLVTFLEDTQEPLSEQIVEHDIEERAPTLTSDGKFEPRGWVGTYPGGVTVTPRWDKITRTEYEEIMNDLRSWTEILGIPTIASVLPFAPDVLIDARTLYASYSRQLIDLTEIVLAHRPPVEARLDTTRGQTVNGHPLFRETMRERARGSPDIVSRQVEFTFQTLPNLLLTRFHAEIAGKLDELMTRYDFFKKELERQLEYHTDFIESGIPADLLSDSLDVDFFDSTTLEKTRRMSSPNMEEVVDLWEAFQRRLSMSFDLQTRLDTAIKPISKLYELWCLSVLVRVLETLTGVTPRIPDSFPTTFQFGDLQLHYNRYLPSQSRYIKKLGANPGRPDFMLESGDDIVWVGDAKFKSTRNIGQSDYTRFISYMLDYIEPGDDSTGTILYANGTPRRDRYQGGEYTVIHTKLRPQNRDTAMEELGAIFEQHISTH